MVEIDPDVRLGKAARIGELWRGETEKLLRRGPAAATESLKVLTCIWAGCQPEQTGVPLQSRAVQLESFAVSHSRAMIAMHAAKTRAKLQWILNKCCTVHNIVFSQLPLSACERAINPLLHF